VIWFDSNFDFKQIWEIIVFESSFLAWIRIRNWIRIKQKCWIRIRIESIRIHNPALKASHGNRKVPTAPRPRSAGPTGWSRSEFLPISLEIRATFQTLSFLRSWYFKKAVNCTTLTGTGHCSQASVWRTHQWSRMESLPIRLEIRATFRTLSLLRSRYLKNTYRTLFPCLGVTHPPVEPQRILPIRFEIALAARDVHLSVS
jgi:hypothetical protein